MTHLSYMYALQGLFLNNNQYRWWLIPHRQRFGGRLRVNSCMFIGGCDVYTCSSWYYRWWHTTKTRDMMAYVPGFVFMSDIGHRPIRVWKMPVWFCGQEDKCPVTFLSVWSLSGYFLITLRHRIADPATGWLPTIQVYIWPINTATAVYFQPPLHSPGHWLAHCVISASLELMGFRVVAINTAYCSLSSTVL